MINPACCVFLSQEVFDDIVEIMSSKAQLQQLGETLLTLCTSQSVLQRLTSDTKV